MSSLNASSRAGRMPRMAEAALARARLTLVPARSIRAPRTPFVTLVLLLLAAGVVGLLVLNTHMQQASFAATGLQQQASALQDQKQELTEQIQQAASPAQLAVQARRLGMVVPEQAAFVRVPTGRVVGEPLAAAVADKLRIAAWPATKPAVLDPKPIVKTQPVDKAAQQLAEKAGQKTTRATTGATSANNRERAGRASQKNTAAAGKKSHDR